MNQLQRTHNSEHQEVSLLLPWHVNKTLLDKENALVEKHLKSCLTCRIEITNLQKLSKSICQEDVLHPLAHISFMKLKSRLHEPVELFKNKNGILDIYSDYVQRLRSFNLKNLISLFAAYTLVPVFLLTFAIVLYGYFITEQTSGMEFHTLSSTKNITPRENEINIVFSKDITQQKMTQILASVQGSVVSGPNLQGVFRVRIGKKKLTSADLKEKALLLRKKAQVIFAEPIFTLLSAKNKS